MLRFMAYIASVTLYATLGTHGASCLLDVGIQGCRYVERSEECIRFNRFREDVLALPRKQLGLNPDKARNTSGMVLSFETDSRAVTAKFGVLSANYLGSGFGVFENGNLIQEFKFGPKDTVAVLEFESTKPGASQFEIALPSFASVEFQGLEVDDFAEVRSVLEDDKPIYVALGDSISHGVGQDGFGHKTWPYLLSEELNIELYNLAVGGGKISVPVGRMLKDWERIDLITILIGYNDLHFDGKTPEQYREKYNELLDAIRINHPTTKIVCITPLYTNKPVSEKTGVNIEVFRTVLEELVAERKKTDSNLVLIEGEKMSSAKNLRADQSQDPVHLSVEGAALFAQSVYAVLNR